MEAVSAHRPRRRSPNVVTVGDFAFLNGSALYVRAITPDGVVFRGAYAWQTCDATYPQAHAFLNGDTAALNA